MNALLGLLLTLAPAPKNSPTIVGRWDAVWENHDTVIRQRMEFTPDGRYASCRFGSGRWLEFPDEDVIRFGEGGKDWDLRITDWKEMTGEVIRVNENGSYGRCYRLRLRPPTWTGPAPTAMRNPAPTGPFLP